MAQQREAKKRSLIVGKVLDSEQSTGKAVLGYTVLTFDNTSSLFSVANVPLRDVESIVKNGGIENAVYEVKDAGKSPIALQGVTEKDLPATYVGQKQPAVEDKVMVLDRVVRKENGREVSVGFRVFNYGGIAFISADKLIHAHKSKTVRSINAKVVTRDGKEILSSKKGNFGVIQDYQKTSKPVKAPTEVSGIALPEKEVTPKLAYINATDEERKKYHLNFRKKAVDFFVRQFMRSGRVRKIKTEREAKFAKVALREFFVKKFPEMKNLKDLGADNRTVVEVGVVLFLSTPEGEKMYMTKKSKGLSHKWEDYKVELGEQQPDKLTLSLISNIRGVISSALSKFLLVRDNCVAYDDTDLGFDEIFIKLEKLVNELDLLLAEEEIKNSVWLKAKVTRLRYDVEKEMRSKGKEFNFVNEPITVSEVDFTSPEGFNKMGYSILADGKAGLYSDTIYGLKRLRGMFDLGIPNLKVDIPSDVQKKILENIYSFGDAEITRTLLILKAVLDLPKPVQDPEIVKQLASIRLAILAHFNLELALVLNTFMGDIAKFSLRDASKSSVKLTANDKVFYMSGMKFNQGNIVLEINRSWSYPRIASGGERQYESANKIPSGLVNLLEELNLGEGLSYAYSTYVETKFELTQALKRRK